MVGTKGAAPFASRMSNERSADELHPRKMERVNGVAPSSQPWQSRVLLLNHTRVKWCPQPDSHPPSLGATAGRASNLEFRTLPLVVLSYGDIVVRASGNAPDPGTDLVRCGV